MRIAAAIGPGHHGQLLLYGLRANGIAYRAVEQWPDLTVTDWDRFGDLRPVARWAWYRHERRLLWAVWRRLPWLGRKETPRTLDYALFDYAVAHFLERCDLFLGWSQVSLHSLGLARRLGMPTLLEHPMSHVDAWVRLVRAEYRRWAGRASGFYSDFPSLLLGRMRREVQLADRISVLSTFARETFVREGVAPERLLTLPLAVDAGHFSPDGGPAPSGRFHVLYVGRVELPKGVPYLLQAVAPLAQGLELALAGPVLPEMEPVLARLGGPHVHLLGMVAARELPACYRQADVVVMPSVNDALGLVILEAMACGVPVIASAHSGGPDIITDGEDGFVVPAGDAAALGDRIATLLADRGRARRMGEAARAKILARYTPAHYAERLYRVLRAAC
jgi:glycosyltransferase involved in cell wall biosynthesis